jgi:spermidine/putrescine transport system permease protein
MIGNVIQSKFLEITDYGQAAALSVILMAVILLLIAVYTRILGTERMAG